MSSVFDNTTILPLVSVIVPVFNTEILLPRCIDSILKQTFSDFELILVDDGSTDNSIDICYQFAKKSSKISVIGKSNGGLSSARLEGFDLARGKYILFVDSDDYIHEDMLRMLVESMEASQSDLAMCGYYVKNGENEKAVLPLRQTNLIRGRDSIIDIYVKPLIGGIPGGYTIPGFIWLRLMKRELIRREYFQPENTYYLEDHIFDLLYADQIDSISIVHLPLYYYCINQNSLTNRYRENKWKMYLNLRDFYLSYIRQRKIDGCDKRIDMFLLSAFCSCVDNAVLSGSYNHYRRELKAMALDGGIPRLKVFALPGGIPKTYFITWMLYSCHLLLLLYKVRKARLVQQSRMCNEGI